MEIYHTQEELTKMNIGYKASFGQDYVVSTGINKGYLYRGLINGTLKFISTNFDSRVDQQISNYINTTPGIITPPGTSVGVLVDYTATALITIYDPVTSLGTVGDSTIIAQRNKIIGIATYSVGAGFIGQAVGFGKITNSAWAWTVGSKIFLNGTTLSTTAPSTGYIQIIGTATASDTIDVKISQSVML